MSLAAGTQKKPPQDDESQAVSDFISSAEDHMETELVKAIDDHLDDDLLPPLDLIVKGLKACIPGCVVAVKNKIGFFVSLLPFSGLLHLLIIDMIAVYIFYYSTYNALYEAVVSGVKHERGHLVWPAADLVDECVGEFVSRQLWMGEYMDNADCFSATTVVGPYDVKSDPSGGDRLIGIINYGCLFICCLLWFVVMGSFIWQNPCFWSVRYDSGAYLKSSYNTRRRFLYRYMCGILGFCAFLTLACLIIVTAANGILGWFIGSQLTTFIVVILSAKAFIAPVKPKFEYKDLDQLKFKRSFYQPNGAFATSLSNALIQCARGAQFRKPLEKLLANPQDRQLALKLCLGRDG